MIVALTQILVVGLPLAMLLDRESSRARLLGLAYLLGSGVVSIVMLALPSWSPVVVTAVIVAIAAILWAIRPIGPTGPISPIGPVRPAFADLLTLVLALAHARAAMRRPVGHWDFWAIWGLKGRTFFEHRGINWTWLEHPWNAFAHPDYPPLLPLSYAFSAMQAGDWNDGHLRVVTTLFAVAALLVVRDFFERELGAKLAAWATLGVASIALSHWIGIAEAPLIAYGATGLLFIRSRRMTLGAILLGCAATTKNEGLTLIVAAAGALVVSQRLRDLPRLGPALAIAAPWQILRAFHVLPTDLLAGPLRDRIVANLAKSSELLLHFWSVQPELWIMLVVALVIFARDLRRERFILTAVALQLLFYVAAILTTPNDLRWQIDYSAGRLLEQVALPLAFATLTILGTKLVPDRDAAAPRI